ncbi:hypothetical protein F4777DRAFT_206751 [Nemania sp. FL0916]|nr:hypothetical protein F4777DRAFT_206751 [Nemania sp. FL0916]
MDDQEVKMISSGDNEQHPFLSTEDIETEFKRVIKKKRRLFQSRNIIIHVVLLIIQITLLTANLVSSRSAVTFFAGDNDHAENSDFSEKVFSPARSAIRYMIEEPDADPNTSHFAGEPRPELDQAWSSLLRSSMIKVSEDELRKMNKTSIALKDGSGYLGYLESIHMLHCVKRIYQAQHPEHYPKLQGTEAFTAGHWDHCLEVLRRGIMCNADVTVNTYFWENPREIKGKSSWPRKCTDWDQIQAWADDRTVRFADQESLLSNLVPSTGE